MPLDAPRLVLLPRLSHWPRTRRLEDEIRKLSDEVSTDPSDADLDAGGLDNGLDIDTLVDPGSGQNA